MRMAARLVLCTAVLTLVPAGSALAQQYPPGACSLTANLSAVSAGDSVIVTGTGFPAGPVDITVNGQPVATATAASNFQTTIQIPANASPPFVIRAGGGDQICTVTLSPAAAGVGRGALAFTGSDSLPLIWIGLAALVVGLALVVAVRRRAATRSRLAAIG